MLLKTSRGVRPTCRGELVRLVRELGIAPSSRVVSLDGGTTWLPMSQVVGVEVDVVDEAAMTGAALTAFAVEHVETLSADAARTRRRALTLFVIAFFAAFTPWVWIRASESSDEGVHTLATAPFGFSFWWGSLCVLASGTAAIVGAVELALPRLLRVRELARWVLLAAAVSCLVLPLIGFAMTWAGAGLPEPLQFLNDVKISLVVVPVGLIVELVVAALALKTASIVWRERSGRPDEPVVRTATPAPVHATIIEPLPLGEAAAGPR